MSCFWGGSNKKLTVPQWPCQSLTKLFTALFSRRFWPASSITRQHPALRSIIRCLPRGFWLQLYKSLLKSFRNSEHYFFQHEIELSESATTGMGQRSHARVFYLQGKRFRCSELIRSFSDSQISAAVAFLMFTLIPDHLRFNAIMQLLQIVE